MSKKLGWIQKKKSRISQGRPRAVAPSLPKLIPITGLSVEKQVYQALSYAMMHGALAPNASLSSRSLSEALGVSPTPVREALKRLDADGALISRSRSAFIVNDPSQNDFAEILEIRLLLECRAIRLAVKNAKKENLELLHKLNKKLIRVDKKGNKFIEEFLRINFQFHFAIYNLCGSTQLIKMIEVLWLRIGPALHHYIPKQSDDLVQNFHNNMITALENGDPEAAEEALTLDLRTGFDSIMPLLKATPVTKV